MYQEMLERQNQPLLIVISGPSGVGKDTVIQHMKERSLPFHFVVTATSRPKRSNEIEGVDYFFVTHQEFAEMIENGELLEYAVVYEDYKGIPKKQVHEALASGSDVVMRVDVQGAKTIRGLYPKALLIFLSAQSEDELIQRLKARRTESPEDLQVRISKLQDEYAYISLFDYYVINADSQLDTTVNTILAIIQSEHHRTLPRVLKP
jgi:guanylate kinase